MIGDRFFAFTMEDRVASTAHADQVIEIVHLITPMFVGSVMGVKVVRAIANLAFPSSPRLNLVRNLFPIIGIEVVLIFKIHNL